MIHVGDIVSKSGDVLHVTLKRYHEYIRVCLIHWRNTLANVELCHDACGGYNEYIRGCLVHRSFQH